VEVIDLNEMSVDALVARIRALGEFDVGTGPDDLEIKERGAVIARVSRSSATVNFPFPRTSLSGNTIASVLQDYPQMRKSSDGFALEISDEESVQTAMRYLARRSRIERYAWQARSDDP
jgi:hypothetical protein